MSPSGSGPGRDAPPETWRSAFLRQARSDFAVFRLLNTSGQPLCQQLHYLQMATEKLAKGFLCSPKADMPPPRVHGAFVRFLRVVRDRPEIRRVCGLGKTQFGGFIDGLLPIAWEIERLAPVGKADRPNPEYPWRQAGSVVSPLDYAFPALDWRGPRIAKVLEFIRKCLELE